MDVVSTNIVTREEYVVGNTLSAVAMKKGPFTERAEGRTHTVCAICTGSAGWSVIEPPAHSA